MANSTFVYVTYIRTNPEKVWNALTDPAFTRQYWVGMHPESDWKAGSRWELHFADGRVADSGEVVAAEPPRRLVLRWRNEFKPELKEEGYSLCTFEIQPVGEAVRLSVTHAIEREPSRFIDAVSGGWPMILSNLKSLLETGAVVLTGWPS
jgi:uncharacterized protein YndB with AHSA1/START domain